MKSSPSRYPHHEHHPSELRRGRGGRRFPWLPAAVLVTLSSAVHAVAVEDPCLTEGESCDIQFDRPPLDGPGMPVSAEWVGGDGAPEGFDVDTWSSSDSLGGAAVSNGGGTASVTVRNSGGELFGPNGADVEGGLEGECLEVKIVWRFRYQVMQVEAGSGQVSIAPEGIGGTWGGSTATHTWVWRYSSVSRGPKQVCPC
jgi:hypothetical protein